jgi:8-oxo-dGTP pyrophosphatase MutT (NUDIX family)
MNATGQGDLENYYNFIERIQKIMLRGNLRTLADIIFRAALAHGELAEKPIAKIKFKPLWSLSETEQATVAQSKTATSDTKAQTAQLYVDMGALDPSEVRKGLAENNEFEIEKLLDDISEEDLVAAWENDPVAEGQGEKSTVIAEMPKSPVPNTDGKDTSASVGVIVLNDTGESVLCGKRSDNELVCGPGGNIQEGETPAQAAIRETQEEFGVTPLNLKRLGQITEFEGGKYGEPIIYLCTEHEGEPKASEEIRHPDFFPMDEFEPEEIDLFPPFAERLKFLEENAQTSFTKNDNHARIKPDNRQKADGWPGIGRYPKGSGDMYSATGANPNIPEMSALAQQRHKKHLANGKSYSGMSMKEYVEKSAELAHSPVGGDIVGYKGSDGCIVRYNRATNDWVKAYETGVATMFKPARGEAYYNEKMIENGGTQDD